MPSWDQCPSLDRHAFALAPAVHGQPCLPVKPVDPLVVLLDTLALDQNVQLAVAEPPPF